MAYTKQTWTNGDTITAAKLNHMEDGIANSSVIIVSFDHDDGTKHYYNKTWQQIHDGLLNGNTIILDKGNEIQQVTGTIIDNDGLYTYSVFIPNYTFWAESADGYIFDETIS